MSTKKLVVFESEPIIENTFKRLSPRFEIRFVEGLLSPANAGQYSEVDFISTDQSILNGEVLKQLNRLELIAVRSTGFDHIEVALARELGVKVCNVPAYAANAVAEHALALLLAVARRMEPAQKFTRRGVFSWEGLKGFELMNKTLAIIGTGAIGKRTAEVFRALGMNILAFDLYPDQAWAEKFSVRYGDLDEILAQADVVSLHVPGLGDGGPLLSSDRFRRMKDGVVILNTARGELIDHPALVKALHSGKVAAAGLDVLPGEHYIREKDRDPESFFGDGFEPRTMLANQLLLQHPKVVITPHIGWFTAEAEQRALDISIGNIESFLLGQPINVVNP